MSSLNNELKSFYLDGKAVRRASLDGKLFYEKHNYNLEVDCDKPILSFKDGDVANITATLTDYDEPMPNETVLIHDSDVEYSEMYFGNQKYEGLTLICRGEGTITFNRGDIIYFYDGTNFIDWRGMSDSLTWSITVSNNIVTLKQGDYTSLTHVLTEDYVKIVFRESFKKVNIISDSWEHFYYKGTTDSNGECAVSYVSRGTGDVNIKCECPRIFVSETYVIQDLNFELDGSEDITSWTSMTNKTENGIYYSHGSYLTQGWSNKGLWQLDFDVMTTSWRYVGLMPICSEEINPFTDAKTTRYAMTTWEGITYMGGLGSSVVSEDPMSKITSTNIWHHVTIKKLSATQVEIIINNTYHSIRNVPNLANLTTLHIGTRDNPASRNTGGIIQYKNINIKSL